MIGKHAGDAIETHAILQKYVERKKRASPGFSIRNLAKQLELSHSFLSRVLNGKKPIPYPLLIRLCKVLDVESEVLETIKAAHTVVLDDGAKTEGTRSPRRGKADVESSIEGWSLGGGKHAKRQLRILRHWYYVPILDLTLLENFDGSIAMIGERLGISTTVAEIAVRELTAAGLLQIENGRIAKTDPKLRFGSGVSLAEIRSFHLQMLKKAEEELKKRVSQEDFDNRLISGMTLTMPKDKLEQVKSQLSEYLHQLVSETVAGGGDEVYYLALQLFPLTRS